MKVGVPGVGFEQKIIAHGHTILIINQNLIEYFTLVSENQRNFTIVLLDFIELFIIVWIL